MKSALLSSLVVASLALALSPLACTDPVRDAEIAALGPEEPDVPPGPDHRPGQPCLHCHTKGGPADGSPFAMAGTIYETNEPGSPGADAIFVQFVDSGGGGPRVIPQSGPSGNFYVPLGDWPDVKYPVRVGLYKDIDEAPTVIMKSLINREGSCNFCHRPNLEKLTADDEDALSDEEFKRREEEIDDSRSSAGQIFMTAGAGS